MKIVAIIQARMGSTRLPGKVFLPLGNSSILGYICDCARKIESISEVVVATTTSKLDDPIVEWCEKNKMPCFRGSEIDLVDRYLKCASYYEADYFLRITGDCPFFSIEMADEIIKSTVNFKAEYGKYTSDNIPIGLRTSVLSLEALRRIDKLGRHPFYREHITLYADERLSEFKTISLSFPEKYQNKNYRLTVDTKLDYKLCKIIVEKLSRNTNLSSDSIIDFLDSCPNYSQINQSVKQIVYKVEK